VKSDHLRLGNRYLSCQFSTFVQCRSTDCSYSLTSPDWLLTTEGGLVWKSPRLCWDELKIINVTHHTIEGVGYDPTNVGESRFAVDIVYHKMEIDFRLVLRYFAPPTYAQNLASSLQVRQSLADDYFVLLPLSAATRAAES
jgi:hypothetical protein